MISRLLVACTAWFILGACSTTPNDTPVDEKMPSKVIVHKDFPSKFVRSRNVEVWLPAGYDPSSDEKYQVLYMHDGQNVFNPETSNTKIDWGVDEAMDSLLAEGKVKPTIVVASWCIGEIRFAEYMPQKPADIMSSPEVSAKLKETMKSPPIMSDHYLKYMVTELKPFIDSTYNTSTKPEHTFVMGSSMGGLLSLYAISEYPNVFGGAGCVSTHWPIPTLGDAYIGQLENALPDPSNHKIYFDHGTKTLDAQYEPYQKRVDAIMEQKGFEKGKNWITKKFEGAEHNEKSWNDRIHIPLEFLLK